ncbi:hypothetical protein C0992_005102 [Termitomyces sp. T32_za158]|nr:hypothetical protein C0992_005102 [Termitomyces sp. T32_za158]
MARTALNFLSDIASINPVIEGPVVVFKLILTLDLTRRENDIKVNAVKARMGSMMAVLLEIARKKGPDSSKLYERLQPFMGDIETSMKDCSSYCDMYEKKSLLRRYLKAPVHEARLAEYASQFSGYETRIERLLETQKSLDIQSERIDIMTQEMREQFRSLFKRLDTTREKNIRHIIESHHGARNSINNDQVLKRLLQISEEDTSDQSGIGIEKLDTTRKSLERELVEDVKEALSQNSTIFQGKLDILSGQINDGNDKLSKMMVSVSALSGGHERIVDPQIQTIWKDMGWKSHTKARHFVHALRDSNLYKGSQITDKKTDRHDYYDEWALSYLSISYDSSATVSLVTGQGRIERYIYPLIYLLLKRDLEIVQLACKHNLYAEEFKKVEDSMSNVFLAFDARRRDLTGEFF